MPHGAIHKKKDKQRKGPEAADSEYRRRLTNFDLEPFEDIIVGRITKMERFNRFIVNIYHPQKKCVLDVQAAVIDKNVSRMKPAIGNLAIIVESGTTYEIYLPFTDADAKSRSNRIHPAIYRSGATEEEDDAGIEFASDEEGETKEEEKAVENKAKRDKVSKHVERVVREENDEVNIDDI